ncbi:hypothetical protein D3C80_1099030 [compost metagenome]
MVARTVLDTVIRIAHTILAVTNHLAVEHQFHWLADICQVQGALARVLLIVQLTVPEVSDRVTHRKYLVIRHQGLQLIAVECQVLGCHAVVQDLVRKHQHAFIPAECRRLAVDCQL